RRSITAPPAPLPSESWASTRTVDRPLPPLPREGQTPPGGASGMEVASRALRAAPPWQRPIPLISCTRLRGREHDVDLHRARGGRVRAAHGTLEPEACARFHRLRGAGGGREDTRC